VNQISVDIKILIADRQNMRMNVFDLNGKEIRSLLMHPNNMNFPVAIEAYARDKYVMLFSLSPGQSLKRIEGLIHFSTYLISAGRSVFTHLEKEQLFWIHSDWGME